MKIGYSEGPINPEGSVSLAGYGYNLERNSKEVVAEGLTASVLAFEDSDGKRLAVCSMDVLSSDPEIVRQVREEAARLQPDMPVPEIFLAATHTHSGPAVSSELIGVGNYNPEYVARVLAPNIALSIIKAFEGSSSGQVMMGESYVEGVSFDRTGNPDPIDTRLTTLKIETEDGVVVGAHFPCHPVSSGKTAQLSADYPGVVRRVIGDTVASDGRFWLTGFCGNINPNVMNSNGPSAIGIPLGRRAVNLLMDGGLHQVVSSDDSIKVTAFDARLPINVDYEMEIPNESSDLDPLQRWIRQVGPNVNSDGRRELAVPVVCAKMGKLALVGVGAELYDSTGVAVGLSAPDLSVVTVPMTGAHRGYVPIRSEYERGTYATARSSYIFGHKPLTPESEEIMRETLIQAVREL